MSFNPVHYAQYRAATTTAAAIPCMHRVALPYDGEKQLHQAFETQCSLCGARHNFLFDRKFTVSTKGEMKAWEAYTSSQAIEVFESKI